MVNRMRRAGGPKPAQRPGGDAHFQKDGSSSPAASWIDIVRAWFARSRERRAVSDLMGLSDHFFKDAGICREEVLREAAKPFWQK
jgi:uncharacterized protein YjiS (DUF1127 family)